MTVAKTILITEDEPAVRKLTATILRSAGYRVLVAASVIEAQTILEQHGNPVDLALTDVMMPGGNGLQLAQHLALVSPATKVLFMSGYAGDSLFQAVMEAEKAPLLDKPFRPDELIRRVAGLLAAPNAAALGASTGGPSQAG